MRLLLALSLIAVLLLGAMCQPPASPEPPSSALEPVAAPAGLGEQAYGHVARLVSFGERWTGSPGWEKAVDYIARELADATGRQPIRDRWQDPVTGLMFENIAVRLPGKSKSRLVIAAHHDTKKFPDFRFVGANDSGSGVGLVLALAEVLAEGSERIATIELVLFDGEECLDPEWNESRALFGSKRYMARERELAAADPSRGAIKAMVLLDMVGAADLQIDEEAYSDPELRAVFAQAAAACGYQDMFFEERLAISDDHLPFLAAGIPAIDLIDLVDNPRWHTAGDTLEHISARSLEIVGEVVLTALPEIARRWCSQPELPVLPEPR